MLSGVVRLIREQALPGPCVGWSQPPCLLMAPRDARVFPEMIFHRNTLLLIH